MIFDGCRLHLNKYYQSEIINYLNGLIECLFPNNHATAFVLGDHQNLSDR